jgi:hypothetical protein
LIDRLSPGLKDIRPLQPSIRRQNWIGAFFAWIPFSMYFIPDWSTDPIDTTTSGFTSTLKGDMLTMEVKNVTIEDGKWLTFEFEATVAPK